MTPSIARGSLVALVTPFDLKGRVDYKTLEQLVLWHIEQGTDGLVCCGTTGEGMTLSEAEKKRVVATCIAVADKKIPIMVRPLNASSSPRLLYRSSVRLRSANRSCPNGRRKNPILS